MEESLDARLTQEVTLLSTKLVTAVAKQLDLEENVLHLHKENSLLKTTVAKLKSFETRYQDLFPKYTKIFNELQESKKKTQDVELENKKLQSEVEDLSESLFNEANQMVSDASRETYNFKVKNRKLYEEIDEKNAIIDNLQSQLKDLKELFIKMEDHQKLALSSRTATPKLDLSQFQNDDLDDKSVSDLQEPEPNFHLQQLQRIIYSPSVKAIRFDLPAYQQDFKSFVYQLIKPDFTFDLTNLKNLRFFKKIWHDELEASIVPVPAVPAASFINRWQKGKNFWNLLVEGKAMIQPVSGVNETFKITYKGKNRRNNEVPVAVKDPCTFCGEFKDDVLEHARLYTLKLISPDPVSLTSLPDYTTINGDKHEVIANYPLCNYCLIKLRNICEFFAKLRLIHSNVYKLKQNSAFDEYAYSSFQFKRNSTPVGDLRRASTSPSLSDSHEHVNVSKPVQTKVPDYDDEAILMKIYVMLIMLRSKIYWSKIGFWDNVEDIEQINIDEISYDAFRIIVREEVTLQANNDVHPNALHVEGITQDIAKTSMEDKTETTTKETETSKAESEVPQTEAEPDVKVEVEVDNDSGDSDEFADTSETFEPVKRSKSKQFKKKMNRDLDDTLEMLQEASRSED